MACGTSRQAAATDRTDPSDPTDRSDKTRRPSPIVGRQAVTLDPKLMTVTLRLRDFVAVAAGNLASRPILAPRLRAAGRLALSAAEPSDRKQPRELPRNLGS